MNTFYTYSIHSDGVNISHLRGVGYRISTTIYKYYSTLILKCILNKKYLHYLFIRRSLQLYQYYIQCIIYCVVWSIFQTRLKG